MKNKRIARSIDFKMIFVFALLALFHACGTDGGSNSSANEILEGEILGELRFDPRISKQIRKRLVEDCVLEEGLSLAASLDFGREVNIQLLKVNADTYKLMSQSKLSNGSKRRLSFLFPRVAIHEEVGRSETALSKVGVGGGDLPSSSNEQEQKESLEKHILVPNWPWPESSEELGLRQKIEEQRDARLSERGLSSGREFSEVLAKPFMAINKALVGDLDEVYAYWSGLTRTNAKELDESDIESYAVIFGLGDAWMNELAQRLSAQEYKPTQYHLLISGWSVCQFNRVGDMDPKEPIVLQFRRDQKNPAVLGYFTYSILASAGLVSIALN